MNRLILPLMASFAVACAAPMNRFGNGDADSGADASVTDTGPMEIDIPVDISTVIPDRPSPPQACGQIDLLFVVDNSASMGDNQVSLAASFPGFVSAMRQRLAFADSYHIGVVTSDAYRYNAPGCQSIGDLVTKTGGLESSMSTCTFGSGQRYMDQSDPNLGANFACAARVGVLGDDDEKMARALMSALEPNRMCNQGFLRRNSLLVVVMITDEDDVPDECNADTPPVCRTYGSGGDNQMWFDTVVRARGGIASNIVMLSLIGRVNNSCGAQIASRLTGFTRRFGNTGLIGDICAMSYDGFFNEALSIIENACRGYIPPPG